MTTFNTPTEALKEVIKRTREVQQAAKAVSVELTAAEAGEEEPEETPEVETTSRPELGQ